MENSDLRIVDNLLITCGQVRYDWALKPFGFEFRDRNPGPVGSLASYRGAPFPSGSAVDHAPRDGRGGESPQGRLGQSSKANPHRDSPMGFFRLALQCVKMFLRGLFGVEQDNDSGVSVIGAFQPLWAAPTCPRSGLCIARRRPPCAPRRCCRRIGPSGSRDGRSGLTGRPSTSPA